MFIIKVCTFIAKELNDKIFIHLCFTESMSYLPNRELDDPASHVSTMAHYWQITKLNCNNGNNSQGI